MGKESAAETTGKLLIAGTFRDAGEGESFGVINPATRATVGQAARGTEEDAREAVEAAREAQTGWAATPAPTRAEVLFRLGELIRTHQEEIARIVTLEEGKPLAEARGEVVQAYNTAMYYAGEGRRMWSMVVPSEQQRKLTFSVRQPLGVVAVITPWNFPSMIPMWNLAPALVTGNTVVFKPASHTPLTAFRLAELFVEAGIPEGVLNLLTGPGGKIGEALVNNPDVDVVAFTGETFTGRHISEINARFMRRQVLELGGKNPMVVAADAKMDLTVAAALWSAFSNAGQKCTAASRIIVEEPVVDAFTKRFVEATERLRVGDGLKEGVEVGPLVSEPGLDKTKKYVEIGLDEGAKLLTGGKGYEDAARKEGFFHQPTVFAGTNDMRISQDEIFGPVTNIIPAPDLGEAMELANDVRYGLASSIYTTDLKAAFDAVSAMEAGVAFVNQGPVGVEVHAPFGGVKESGYGRELGEAALDDYTDKKTVYVDYSYEKQPWYFPWG
ncbi:MAG: aldehyde dehydrogenase family protein [Thermoplasmata archaeon]